MTLIDLGDSIPSNTAHAVSVSLPTWKANVGYEEGEQWVVGSMMTGYPRFFIHKTIQALSADILAKHGRPGQSAMLFPTRRAAQRCADFIQDKAEQPEPVVDVSILSLHLDPTRDFSEPLRSISPSISAVVFPEALFPVAKQYWQHSGDGVSSRRAEFCLNLFRDGLLILNDRSPSPRSPQQQKLRRGPKRYQKRSSIDDTESPNNTTNGKPANPPSPPPEELADSIESSRFLEERYGRNLDVSLVENAKSAIRRRIAGVISTDLHELSHAAAAPPMESNARGVSDLQEHDIYLTPCGMNAIFTSHQALLQARPPQKSVNFGFPYVDTLKILQKFGPGAVFYGHGSSADLDDLEARLKGGERVLALFCEFPGNPLLTCPDLKRIRTLADTYDFAVVVDETIGNFVNVNVLPLADIVVSSLTKIFSGDCNVMGGSIILNPSGKFYTSLKTSMAAVFEDNYWCEDVMFMERNSRDFVTRIDRVNVNAETISDALQAHPLVDKVFYPKCNASRANYEACRLPKGGYGGLLSCTLKSKALSIAFYDALETAKGPSLGTNFTLTSPYVILAHYQELDWAASFGVDPNLLRISVGLEDDLGEIFARALKAAEAV
ncbi:pyridoxal phosphate-dependent transferase [Astrocystis sublimbata]|nr:pyridoxal phosphate-dependent transferase [Astrocystis sublimbata]